jgi:putative ABC transport system permease protein
VSASARPPHSARIQRARLPVRELFGTAAAGLSTRRLRAALSALGIAIGIGAMVAVVGVSSSTQANLLSEIDALGTNLLTVTPGQTFTGNNEALPNTALAMIAHIRHVDSDVAVEQVPSANVYRTPLVPSDQTGGIGVDAAGKDLPRVMGVTLASGHFLDTVAARYPEAVLGAQAARVLQITRVGGHVLVDLGNTWFSVVGILRPVLLDSTLDSEVYISLSVAKRMFHAAANPSEIYLRARVDTVGVVSGLLAPTANPQHPDAVNVSRPSDALAARAVTKGQFTTLLLGLGAVALLVGAIGIINIMVISVLERRTEIGLRRALGATRRHISVQFLTESAMLAAIGGVTGLLLGAGATQVYALTRHEPFVLPLYALITAPAVGLAIGVVAGIYPAAKAAQLSPTEALRT